MLKMRGLYRNRIIVYLIRQANRNDGLNEIVHVRLLGTTYVSPMYQISKVAVI
jgi:hypothetical protein